MRQDGPEARSWAARSRVGYNAAVHTRAEPRQVARNVVGYSRGSLGADTFDLDTSQDSPAFPAAVEWVAGAILDSRGRAMPRAAGAGRPWAADIADAAGPGGQDFAVCLLAVSSTAVETAGEAAPNNGVGSYVEAMPDESCSGAGQVPL
jgi:hypothetical protein